MWRTVALVVLIIASYYLMYDTGSVKTPGEKHEQKAIEKMVQDAKTIRQQQDKAYEEATKGMK